MQPAPPATPSSFASPWPEWLRPALLLVAVTAAYFNSLHVPFLLDDEDNIVGNESLRSLGTALWPRRDVLTAGRPLLNASFALNYLVGGNNVGGYHAINLALHLLATLTLFALVRRTLTLPRLCAPFANTAASVAFGAALLWALHPLQTSAVTYLSQRAESLMGLCYLFSLYAVLRSAAPHAPARWKILAVAACGAGMMTKEVMVTAPVVILIFDRVFLAGSFRGAWRARRTLYLGLAATWLVLGALMLGSKIQARGVGYGFEHTWFQYLQIETGALVHYLRLAVWPFPLVFDYGEEVVAPGATALAFCATLLGAIFLGLAIAWRRWPAVAFLGASFFLLLAPTSSIVPVAGQPIAESRLYLPLAAVAVLGAIGLARLAAARSQTIMLALAAALGVTTFARNHDYRTADSIWTDTIAKRPGSARAHSHRGFAYLRAGRLDDGIADLREAVRISASHAFAHANLAAAYAAQNRPEAAIPHFEHALRLRPADAGVLSNFGTTLFRAGRKAEAAERYRAALRLRPDHAEARVNLGIALAHLGQFGEARAEFLETLRLHPGHAGARGELGQLDDFLRRQPPGSR